LEGCINILEYNHPIKRKPHSRLALEKTSHLDKGWSFSGLWVRQTDRQTDLSVFR
jgi:hypothetical protein